MTRKRFAGRTVVVAMATIAAVVGAGPKARATEGYFQHGYSAVQQSTAGAGTANPEDAMTVATNPAGLLSVGTGFEIGISLFSPHRRYSVPPGFGFVAPGTVTSTWNNFVIPNFAYSQQIDANSAWGIALYGNGGMNTDYAGFIANPACPGGDGVFCGGKAGVNLSQMFISPSYARRFGNIAIGVAPVLAVQMFSAYGLGAFSPLSSSPSNLTDNGQAMSYGGGLRVGALLSVTPTLRFSVSGATPIWMTKFNKYQGLFADHGSFNIPANVGVGVAWDPAPDWTVMLDYKHIFYSDIKSISTPSAFVGAPFGSANGPGFGWHDVDVVAIGAEWRVDPAWTLRAGYAHNTNPISSSDVTLNILAPGVVTDHISAGFSYKVNQRSTIDFAGTYVPWHSVSGPEVVPGLGPTGRTIKLSMYQYDFTLAWRYAF